MKKILIVEDERIVRNLVKKKLVAEGYEVELAVDGKDGLEKIEEADPDLVLLDILMPRMNGIEFLEEIRKIEKFKKLPVIIVSNSGQPVEIDKARKLGVEEWIVKTEFDPREIIKKVNEQVGK